MLAKIVLAVGAGLDVGSTLLFEILYVKNIESLAVVVKIVFFAGSWVHV